MRHPQPARWLVAGAVAMIALATTAHRADARVPAVPLLAHAAIAVPSRRPIVLTLPRDLVPPLEHRALLPSHPAPIDGDDGLFFGPVFIDADHAGQVRKMTKTMPAPLKKIVFGRVGPWAMSGQPLGNVVAAGPAMYARF